MLDKNIHILKSIISDMELLNESFLLLGDEEFILEDLKNNVNKLLEECNDIDLKEELEKVKNDIKYNKQIQKPKKLKEILWTKNS